MNLKIKKVHAALGVGLLTALSFTPTLNTEAALTPPTGWDLKYTNEDFPGYKIRNTTSSTTPLYTRTTDGAYYNYTTTWSNTNSGIIPNGLSITMTFNRSNTTWYDAGSGNYVPSDTKVGSTNAVGTITNKLFVSFNNQTNKDYRLYLDVSSTPNGTSFDVKLKNIDYNFYYDNVFFEPISQLKNFVIPSYMVLEVAMSSTSAARYLDAWYLDDLGVSDSYNNGYDDGYDVGNSVGYEDGYTDGYGESPNLLVTGFQAMVGILVNFVLMIVNLEVFGVSIMGIFAIIVLFTGIVWVLKLVRG